MAEGSNTNNNNSRSQTIESSYRSSSTFSTSGPSVRYLKKDIAEVLVQCLAEVCEVRPKDPIDYIAHYLYKYADAELYYYEKVMFNKECQLMVLDYHRMQVRKQNLIEMINNKMKELRSSMKGSNIGAKKADHYLGQLMHAQINTELFKALPLRDMAESIQNITNPDLQEGYDDDERHTEIMSSLRDEMDKQTLSSKRSTEDTVFRDKLFLSKGKKRKENSIDIPEDILQARIREMTRANSEDDVSASLPGQLKDNSVDDKSKESQKESVQFHVPAEDSMIKRKLSKVETRQKWKKANSNLRAVMQINAFTTMAQTIAKSAKDEASARVYELASSRKKISEITCNYTKAAKEAELTDSKLRVEIEKEMDANEKTERALITSAMWKQQAFANLELEENVLEHIKRKMKIEVAEKKKVDWLIDRLLYRYPADLMATEKAINKHEDAVLRLTKKLRFFDIEKKNATSVEGREKSEIKEKETKNRIKEKEEIIKEESKTLEILREAYYIERQNEMHVEIAQNKAILENMDAAIEECNANIHDAMGRREAIKKELKQIKVLETKKRTKDFTEAKFQKIKAKLLADMEEIEVEIQEIAMDVKVKEEARNKHIDYTDKLQMVLANYSMSNLPELRDCTRRKQLYIGQMLSAIKEQKIKIRNIQIRLKLGRKISSGEAIQQAAQESASSSLGSNVSDTWMKNFLADNESAKSSRMSDGRMSGYTDLFGSPTRSGASGNISSEHSQIFKPDEIAVKIAKSKSKSREDARKTMSGGKSGRKMSRPSGASLGKDRQKVQRTESEREARRVQKRQQRELSLEQHDEDGGPATSGPIDGVRKKRMVRKVRQKPGEDGQISDEDLPGTKQDRFRRMSMHVKNTKRLGRKIKQKPVEEDGHIAEKQSEEEYMSFSDTRDSYDSSETLISSSYDTWLSTYHRDDGPYKIKKRQIQLNVDRDDEDGGDDPNSENADNGDEQVKHRARKGKSETRQQKHKARQAKRDNRRMVDGADNSDGEDQQQDRQRSPRRGKNMYGEDQTPDRLRSPRRGKTKQGKKRYAAVEQKNSLTGEIIRRTSEPGELGEHKEPRKHREPRLDGTIGTGEDETFSEFGEEFIEGGSYADWYSSGSEEEEEDKEVDGTSEQSNYSALFEVHCEWSLESPFNLVCRHPVLGTIRSKHPRPTQLADRPIYWEENDFKKEVFYEGEMYSDTSMVWQPKPPTIPAPVPAKKPVARNGDKNSIVLKK